MTEPRQAVLEALYERDSVPSAEPAELGGKAGVLLSGVLSHLDDLDELIEGASSGWRVSRMPVVDRNVLRMAVFELVHQRDTPVGVVINEAVALAKHYSTTKSSAFVNGVLAAIADEVRSGP